MHNSASGQHEDDVREVNQSLGQSPRFGPFSGKQFTICGVIFCLVFGLLFFIFGMDTASSLIPATWLSFTAAVLSGDKPHRYWGKWWGMLFRPTWVKGVSVQTDPLKKKRVGSRRLKLGKRSKRVNPIEDEFHLASLVRLEKTGKAVGAYLLNRNTKHQQGLVEGLQLIFGYSCEGIHPFPRRENHWEAYDKVIGDANKELPAGEHFDIRWSSFCDDSDAKEFLLERIENPASKESEFLDWAQIKKAENLVENRVRRRIKLDIYSSFTISIKRDEEDAIDRAIARFGSSINRQKRRLAKTYRRYLLPNGNADLNREELINAFRRSLEVAERHHQILSKAKLRPAFKDEETLWKEACTRLGSNYFPLPHKLVFDGRTVREEFGSTNTDQEYEKPLRYILGHEHHVMTQVFNNHELPTSDYRWVTLPVPGSDPTDTCNVPKRKYIGLLALAHKPGHFKGGRKGSKGQLRFLWDLLNRFHDIEIHTQMSPADVGLTRSAQQMITRQNKNLDISAQQKKTVEVSAQINVYRSVEAQKRLYTGDKPINIAVVILVHRNTPEEVDNACREICGIVPDPVQLERETLYAWRTWLQTTMLRYEGLLLQPFNRRVTLHATEASGLCCLIKPRSFDKNSGFEVIADEGGCPLKLDFSNPVHKMIGGATGAGKSLLTGGMVAEAMARDMRFMIVDLPSKDGTGTFGDFTNYYDGTYFDISRESTNLVEPLDLTGVPKDEHEDRNRLHLADMNLIVQQLVLGSRVYEGLLAARIESLIPLGLNAFFADPGIQRRFAYGLKAPIGSADWKATPTLPDLEPFYSSECINLGYEDPDSDAALRFIRLQLKAWEHSPVGNSICKPTSFKGEGKLITFALTNLNPSNPREAEIFGIAAYLAASRQELSTRKGSVLFFDEFSVLSKYDVLSTMYGRKTATARKAHSTCICAFQDIESVINSTAGSQIRANSPQRFIGRINPGTAQSFADAFNIPYSIVEECEHYEPNISELYTPWLLDYNNTYTKCRYYPNLPLLALTSNSRQERLAREEFKKRYSNKFQWVSKYGMHYGKTLQQGKSL